MKNLIILIVAMAAGLLLYNFKSDSRAVVSANTSAAKVDMPANVKAIVDNSCNGCHNSGSQNEKAKKKLSFDNLNSLKTFQLVGTLQKIYTEVDSSKMPPPRFLQKYPEHALSESDKQVLLSWANETNKKLMK